MSADQRNVLRDSSHSRIMPRTPSVATDHWYDIVARSAHLGTSRTAHDRSVRQSIASTAGQLHRNPHHCREGRAASRTPRDVIKQRTDPDLSICFMLIAIKWKNQAGLWRRQLGIVGKMPRAYDVKRPTKDGC